MLERFKYPIFAALSVAILIGVIALLTYRPPATVITIIPPAPTATPGPMRVYMTGALLKPNQVVEVPRGSRVSDAISAAGGFAPDADQIKVNLARLLQDGEQINIPARPAATSTPAPAQPTKPGSTPAPSIAPTIVRSIAPTTAGSAKSEKATTDSPVYINTADEQELQRLPGVGPKLAQQIIEYRTANGPFQEMQDLDKVSGIGPATLSKWEGLIIFQ